MSEEWRFKVRLVMVWYVVLGFLLVVRAAPPTEHNGRSFRNALNQQGLQTILQSIEERLRNLDQVYSIRYASPNPDIVRKIEILENKLSRMESQIQVQLEKISENMSSKNFKDDLTKDQLFRKMDSVYERINHKLSYVEGKLDMDVLKLQTKIEAAVSKIERLDHSFSVRQADMEAEVSDAVEIMENVKNNVMTVENKLVNVTKNTIETSFDKQINFMHEKFDNVTHLIIQINNKMNNTEQCNQKDVMNDFTTKDTHLTKTFKGYEDQIQSYGNKVNNMYHELWKKSTTIENTIKNSVLLMNLTRKEIQDLKKAEHNSPTDQSQNDGQLEIIVDSFTNTIQRKFAELGRKLESNFENVMLVQNLFLESCHRIQMDEAQLENKISAVLEKLLDAVTNRSINTFKEIQSMEELIKSHDTNVYRALHQNTNTIIKLSEKTSEDRKKLEKILSTIKKDIGNALETIQNEISSEDQENNQKFDTIANILLELQEQVNDLDSRVNEDNINYNAKQILQDILLATKRLPDKDTFAERLNMTIFHNVRDLSDVMSNIYHLLTTIDTKINNSYFAVNNQLNDPGVINNTHTENITKLSAQRNGKINLSEVTEPVDIVLEILPEKTEKNASKSLSRLIYTVIMDDQEDENEDESSTTTIKYENKQGQLQNEEITTENIIDNWFWWYNSDQDTNENISQEELRTTTTGKSNIMKRYKKYNNFEGIVINGQSNINEDTVLSIPVPSTTKETISSNENYQTTNENSKITKRYKKYNNFEGIVINGQSNINEDTVLSIPVPSNTKDTISSNENLQTTTEKSKIIKRNKKHKNFEGIVINGQITDDFTLNLPSTTINYKATVITPNENPQSQEGLPRTARNPEIMKQYKKNKMFHGIIINGVDNVDVPVAETVAPDISQADEQEHAHTTDIAVNNDTNNSSRYPLRENDASIEKEIKGFQTAAKSSKNKNNSVNINAHETVTNPAENTTENPEESKQNKNSYVSAGSTIADIPVSDYTFKSTKETTEMFDGTLDEILESTTTNPINSFEYTDLKNNTNEENIRDEYEWDYEE